MLHLNFVEKGIPLGVISGQQLINLPQLAQGIYTHILDSSDLLIMRGATNTTATAVDDASAVVCAIMNAAIMEASNVMAAAVNKIAAYNITASHPTTRVPEPIVQSAPPEPVTETSQTSPVPIPVPIAPPEHVAETSETSIAQARAPVHVLVKPPDDDIPPMIPKPSMITERNREAVALRTVKYANENFKSDLNGGWKCTVSGCPYHKNNVKWLISHLKNKHNIIAPDLNSYLFPPKV